MRFYELLQAALDGNYHSIDAEFFDSEISRLRATVQEMNTKFAAYMRLSVQRRKFKPDAEPEDSTSESGNPDDAETADETGQLIVSKTEMMRWVKQVSLRLSHGHAASNDFVGIFPHQREGTCRKQ